MGRCGEMWGGVGRCGEMWGDVGRWGEMAVCGVEGAHQAREFGDGGDGAPGEMWGDVGGRWARCGEVWEV